MNDHQKEMFREAEHDHREAVKRDPHYAAELQKELHEVAMRHKVTSWQPTDQVRQTWIALDANEQNILDWMNGDLSSRPKDPDWPGPRPQTPTRSASARQSSADRWGLAVRLQQAHGGQAEGQLVSPFSVLFAAGGYANPGGGIFLLGHCEEGFHRRLPEDPLRGRIWAVLYGI